MAQFVDALSRFGWLNDRGDPIRATAMDSALAVQVPPMVRPWALAHQFALGAVSVVDLHTATRQKHLGDVDGAIELARIALGRMFASGDLIWRGRATTILVESLLLRGTEDDIAEAQAAIDRLAAVPTDPGYVMHELPLLRMRALLAQAQGYNDAYRDYRDRYRTMATDLGFEGHMKWAEAMT